MKKIPLLLFSLLICQYNYSLEDINSASNSYESFIKRYPEVIQIKEKLLEYTRANLTTEHIVKSMISDTLKYYI